MAKDQGMLVRPNASSLLQNSSCITNWSVDFQVSRGRERLSSLKTSLRRKRSTLGRLIGKMSAMTRRSLGDMDRDYFLPFDDTSGCTVRGFGLVG